LRRLVEVLGVAAILQRTRSPYVNDALNEDEALNRICDAGEDEPTYPIEDLLTTTSQLSFEIEGITIDDDDLALVGEGEVVVTECVEGHSELTQVIVPLATTGCKVLTGVITLIKCIFDESNERGIRTKRASRREGNAMRRWARRTWLFLLTALSVGAIGRNSVAQSCDPLPTDMSSPLRYQFRANTPRCEGLFTKVVAGGEGMSLVSLTIGHVLYDFNTDPSIEIRFADAPEATTRIQGVGVPLQLYYRLDAQLPSGQTAFRLPLHDVIAPRQIDAEKFGVYGIRVLADGTIGYVPVYAGRPGALRPSDIVAVVRPGSDVTNVAWRIYDPAHTMSWVPLPDAAGLVPQGKRLDVDIGRTLPGARNTLELSFYLDGIPRTDRFVLLAR